MLMSYFLNYQLVLTVSYELRLKLIINKVTKRFPIGRALLIGSWPDIMHLVFLLFLLCRSLNVPLCWRYRQNYTRKNEYIWTGEAYFEIKLSENQCVYVNSHQKEAQTENLKVIFCFPWISSHYQMRCQWQYFWVNNGTSSVNIKTAHICLLHLSKKGKDSRAACSIHHNSSSAIWEDDIWVSPSS